MNDATCLRAELAEALRICLAQLGEYQDGDGAAKFHAINIARVALAKEASAPKHGVCCTCGYDGVEETPCAKRDEAHCDHWWDGPGEPEGKNS